jgi:hypothetical protein
MRENERERERERERKRERERERKGVKGEKEYLGRRIWMERINNVVGSGRRI